MDRIGKLAYGKVTGNLKSAIKEFEPINKRICSLRSKLKWFNLILFSVHASTEPDDKEIFYELLEQHFTPAP